MPIVSTDPYECTTYGVHSTLLQEQLDTFFPVAGSGLDCFRWSGFGTVCLPCSVDPDITSLIPATFGPAAAGYLDRFVFTLNTPDGGPEGYTAHCVNTPPVCGSTQCAYWQYNGAVAPLGTLATCRFQYEGDGGIGSGPDSRSVLYDYRPHYNEDLGAWRCWCCPQGYYYDPVSGRCLSELCDPGYCWCEGQGSCVPCQAPCAGTPGVSCTWDTNTCQWVCTHPPCPPSSRWSWQSCSCQAVCDPDQCWCERDGRCIDCEIDCADELNCEWDAATCQWECDTPACPTGQVWNWYGCRCVPECPPGECWCEDPYSYTGGSCVPCPPVDCAEELGCQWDVVTCAWVCADPETVCGPERTWTGAPDCRCAGLSPWNLEDLGGRYHEASDRKGIRYRRSEFPVPPFVLDTGVTAEPEDSQPRMARLRSGRILLLFRRQGRGVGEMRSDDDGETWQEFATMFPGGGDPVLSVHPRTGVIFRGARVSGELQGSLQYPGDELPQDAFTLQLWDPDTETLGDMPPGSGSWNVEPAAEGHGRWVLVLAVGGEARRYASADDCLTWEEVPDA